MPVHNSEIAVLLDRLGTLLEVEDANPFRVRAYHAAARTVRSLPRRVAAMVEAGEPLDELPAIGGDLAGKIAEIVRTGHLEALEEAEARLPKGILALLGLGGLGPKRVHRLIEELGIDSAEALGEAARSGRLRALSGFGEKTEANILRDLAAHRDTGEHRMPRLAAAAVVDVGEGSK